MIFGYRDVKSEEEDRLLTDISGVKKKYFTLNGIREHAIELNEETAIRLKVQAAEYEFLYREARRRKVIAFDTSNVITH